MQKKKNDYKPLGISMSATDRERVRQDLAKTPYRSLSEYMRKKIFDEPVTIYYRNKSYDIFTEAYTAFKRDLDVILEKGTFTEVEKKWLCEEIRIVKDIIAQLYDHVRESGKVNKKPLSVPGL